MFHSHVENKKRNKKHIKLFISRYNLDLNNYTRIASEIILFSRFLYVAGPSGDLINGFVYDINNFIIMAYHFFSTKSGITECFSHPRPTRAAER